MGHEAYDGEDDKACKHAGAGVDAADDDGVPGGSGQCQLGGTQRAEVMEAATGVRGGTGRQGSGTSQGKVSGQGQE